MTTAAEFQAIDNAKLQEAAAANNPNGLKVGDICCLRSGGPQATVTHAGHDYATIAWTDYKGAINTFSGPFACFSPPLNAPSAS